MTQPIKTAPNQPMKKVSTQPSVHAAGMYTPSNNEHNVTVVGNTEYGGLDEAPGIESKNQPQRRHPSWTQYQKILTPALNMQLWNTQ